MPLTATAVKQAKAKEKPYKLSDEKGMFLLVNPNGCKDVREVIIENGPPIYAFDMGDGRRAFQFRWGGGSFVIPQRTTVTGSSTAVGGSGWYSGSAITSGGGVITSEGCVLTYFARWNEVKNAWIVTEYRVPKQLVC